MIRTVQDYLDFCPSTEDVLSAWSGIRPLVRDLSRGEEAETKQLSRDHVLLGKAVRLPNTHVVALVSLLSPLVSEQSAQGRSSQCRGASGPPIDRWQRRRLRKP